MTARPGMPVNAPAAAPAWAFLRLVAIEHSVFALPFAYLSALAAGAGWADLALITVAMVGARTFAMAANRIVDRHIDARNPRTAKRELVTGAVSAASLVNSPVATACFACHDTDLARTHMEINGGSIYAPRGTALGTMETCMICHAPGRIADIKVMHAK